MNGLLQIIFVSYTYTRIPMDAVEALVESVEQVHITRQKLTEEQMNTLRLENERLKEENRRITMELAEKRELVAELRREVRKFRSILHKTRGITIRPRESLMSDIDIEDVKKIMDAQIRHMLVQRINAEL
jgi:cell shape-determining protein MreC